jgi:hypothetical protein
MVAGLLLTFLALLFLLCALAVGKGIPGKPEELLLWAVLFLICFLPGIVFLWIGTRPYVVEFDKEFRRLFISMPRKPLFLQSRVEVPLDEVKFFLLAPLVERGRHTGAVGNILLDLRAVMEAEGKKRRPPLRLTGLVSCNHRSAEVEALVAAAGELASGSGKKLMGPRFLTYAEGNFRAFDKAEDHRPVPLFDPDAHPEVET